MASEATPSFGRLCPAMTLRSWHPFIPDFAGA